MKMTQQASAASADSHVPIPANPLQEEESTNAVSAHNEANNFQSQKIQYGQTQTQDTKTTGTSTTRLMSVPSRHFITFDTSARQEKLQKAASASAKKVRARLAKQQARKKRSETSTSDTASPTTLRCSSRHKTDKTKTVSVPRSGSKRNVLYAKSVPKPVPSHIVPPIPRSKSPLVRKLGKTRIPSLLEHRVNEALVRRAKGNSLKIREVNREDQIARLPSFTPNLFHNDTCKGCTEYRTLQKEAESKFALDQDVVLQQSKQVQSLTSIVDELMDAQDKQKELIASLRRKIQAAMDEIASLRAKASNNGNGETPLDDLSHDHPLPPRMVMSRPRPKFEYPILEECQDRVSGDWNFGCLNGDSDLTTKIAALRTALSARQALQNEIRHRISKAHEILNDHFSHLSTHPEATISELQTHVKIHQKFLRWLKKFVVDGIHDIQNFEKAFIFAPGRRVRYYYEGKMPLNDGDGPASEEAQEVEGIFIPIDVHKRAESMWLEAEQLKALESSAWAKRAEKCTSTLDLIALRHEETFTYAIPNNPEVSTSTNDLTTMKNAETETEAETDAVSACPKVSQTLAAFFSCQDCENLLEPAPPQRRRCTLTCVARFPEQSPQDLVPSPSPPADQDQVDQVQECSSANSFMEELYRRPMGAAIEQVSCEVFGTGTYASKNSSLESINERVASVRQLVKACSQESMEIMQNIERIKSRSHSRSQINIPESRLVAPSQTECERDLCEQRCLEPETESVDAVISAFTNLAKEIVSASSSEDSICTNYVQSYESKLQIDANSNWSNFAFTQADWADTNNNNTCLESEVNDLMVKLKKDSNCTENGVAIDKEQNQSTISANANVKRSRIPQPRPRRSKLKQAAWNFSNLSSIEEEPEEVRRGGSRMVEAGVPIPAERLTRRQAGKSLIPRLRSKSQSVGRVPANEIIAGADSVNPVRSSSSHSSRTRNYSPRPSPLASPRTPRHPRASQKQNQASEDSEAPLPLQSKYDTKRVPVFPRSIRPDSTPNANVESERIISLPSAPTVAPRARKSSYTTEYSSAYGLKPFLPDSGNNTSTSE